MRKLKADKAAKPDIEEAVKKLLALKADFKSATGVDWKPGTSVQDTAKTAPAAAASESNSSGMFSIVKTLHINQLKVISTLNSV